MSYKMSEVSAMGIGKLIDTSHHLLLLELFLDHGLQELVPRGAGKQQRALVALSGW